MVRAARSKTCAAALVFAAGAAGAWACVGDFPAATYSELDGGGDATTPADGPPDTGETHDVGALVDAFEAAADVTPAPDAADGNSPEACTDLAADPSGIFVSAASGSDPEFVPEIGDAGLDAADSALDAADSALDAANDDGGDAADTGANDAAHDGGGDAGGDAAVDGGQDAGPRGDGGMDHPVKTIGAAIRLATTTGRIYLEEGTYPEFVTVEGRADAGAPPLVIEGGFARKNGVWARACAPIDDLRGHTVIASPGPTGVLFHDVRDGSSLSFVTVRTAPLPTADPGAPPSSSSAVVVEGQRSNVLLSDVRLLPAPAQLAERPAKPSHPFASFCGGASGNGGRGASGSAGGDSAGGSIQLDAFPWFVVGSGAPGGGGGSGQPGTPGGQPSPTCYSGLAASCVGAITIGCSSSPPTFGAGAFPGASGCGGTATPGGRGGAGGASSTALAVLGSHAHVDVRRSTLVANDATDGTPGGDGGDVDPGTPGVAGSNGNCPGPPVSCGNNTCCCMFSASIAGAVAAGGHGGSAGAAGNGGAGAGGSSCGTVGAASAITLDPASSVAFGRAGKGAGSAPDGQAQASCP